MQIYNDNLLYNEEFVRQGNYSFSLPSDLQEHFIEYLSRVNDECCDEVDNKMQGVVRRMGLIAYRIMMVLTAVRHLENMPHESYSSDETIQLICHKYDYWKIQCKMPPKTKRFYPLVPK